MVYQAVSEQIFSESFVSQSDYIWRTKLTTTVKGIPPFKDEIMGGTYSFSLTDILNSPGFF